MQGTLCTCTYACDEGIRHGYCPAHYIAHVSCLTSWLHSLNYLWYVFSSKDNWMSHSWLVIIILDSYYKCLSNKWWFLLLFRAFYFSPFVKPIAPELIKRYFIAHGYLCYSNGAKNVGPTPYIAICSIMRPCFIGKPDTTIPMYLRKRVWVGAVCGCKIWSLHKSIVWGYQVCSVHPLCDMMSTWWCTEYITCWSAHENVINYTTGGKIANEKLTLLAFTCIATLTRHFSFQAYHYNSFILEKSWDGQVCNTV